MVVEARELAASRYVMHRLQDKNDLEYREQIETALDETGDFLEEEKVKAELDVMIVDQMQKYDEAWLQDFLAKRMEGGAKWPIS